MIVGSGLIARSLAKIDSSNFIFFASGVSNSQEADENQFARERNLLTRFLGEKSLDFFYFSTCSVLDKTPIMSPYVSHKLKMEELVLNHSGKSCVVRLPNVVGPGGNQNNLINFIKNRLVSGEEIKVYEDARRYLLDVEDIPSVLYSYKSLEITGNRTFNIVPNESISVLKIISTLEGSGKFRIPNVTLLPGGSHYEINSPETRRISESIGLDFGSGYNERVIMKWL